MKTEYDPIFTGAEIVQQRWAETMIRLKHFKLEQKLCNILDIKSHELNQNMDIKCMYDLVLYYDLLR